MELSTYAGWNQVPEDWQRVLGLEPNGCFCIEVSGRVVATATLLTYGQELAWLGMVLTHPEHQRRGHARKVVEATLQYADRGGIQCVKLDATDQGRPLYQSVGFVDEQPIERWLRQPGPLTTIVTDEVRGAPDFALDRMAFGADRSALLKRLGPALVDGEGFALGRAGSKANYLGPVVARSAAAASRLSRALLAERSDEAWFVDVLPENRSAAEVAEGLGFESVRHLVRMYRGAHRHGDDTMVYAIAGFEAG
jgi:predicted GNAT family acetyltransferase